MIISFRSKLIFLVILTNIMLAVGVWQLASGGQKIKKQVELFVPAVGYLQGISAVNSAMTRQAKEVFDFLILHKEEDKDEFIASSLELEKYFQLWQQSAARQQALGVEGEEEDLTLYNDTYVAYQNWHQSMRVVISLAEVGDWTTAQQLFHESWSSSLDKQLLPAIDTALKDGLIEVENTYHGLLLAVGHVPWGARRNAILLEQIHASMNFLIGGNQVNANVNTQFAMLVDYLLHDNEKSLQHFYRSQVISDEALISWSQAAEKIAPLPQDQSRTAPFKVALIETAYQRFSQQAARAIALKKSGQADAALEIIVRHENQLISDFHSSISEAVKEGAQSLLARVNGFRTTGIMLLVLFLSASSLLSIGMVRDMLRSLKTLNSGMTAIRSGDLGQRIILKKNDIMGTLAQTFNSMMDSLHRSQTSLEELTAELEQRVEDRTKQLASANENLAAFNSMVSHDLRAPLTTIYGYSQLLLQKHKDQESLESVASLEKILSASESMSRIVSSLEVLSHAGHKTLTPESIDLGEMASNILAQLATADPQREVETIISPSPAVTGDRGLVEIALTNLLSNAWKYTGKTTAARIEFGMLREAELPIWYVRDNGAGFDMKRVDQLFKTFGRLHSKDDFLGTGIGLSTVQRIIQRHGGEIRAEGKEGGGATFYFHFGREC